MRVSILFFLSLLICTSCTYSINLVHTEGQADDVVMERQSNYPDVSPNLNVPIKPL